ncbi:MAG: hypothetical protein H2069_09005 [Legionella sp.]|nr:hypothetical protein [Legionella sp.]
MKQHIAIPVKKYVFLPVNEMNSEKFCGFYTRNLCECVFMYVRSDIGCAAAHFSRLDSATFLANQVKEDFVNARWIEITLVGGYFNQVVVPWKFDKRELKINSKLIRNNDLEAQRKIYSLNDEEEVIELEDYEPNFFSKKFLNQNLDGLYKVDLKTVDKEIKKKHFRAFFSNYVIGENALSISFRPKGMKDFMGCQNILSLAAQLKNTLKTPNLRLQHFFCENDSEVRVDFAKKNVEKHIHAGELNVDPQSLTFYPGTLNIPNKISYYPLTPAKKAKAFMNGLCHFKKEKPNHENKGYSKYCC